MKLTSVVLSVGIILALTACSGKEEPDAAMRVAQADGRVLEIRKTLEATRVEARDCREQLSAKERSTWMALAAAVATFFAGVSVGTKAKRRSSDAASSRVS